jgi:hypothetical protein
VRRLPRNSKGLIELREQGLAPELPVLISLIGKLDFDNVTLYAKPSESYDWQPIAALDVEVFAAVSVPFPELLRTLAEIAASVPRHMVLTFAEGPRVDCGEMRVLQDFALFDWFPMSIGPCAYPQGTILARKLLDALGKELPIPYDRAVGLVLETMREKSQCA